MATPALVSSFWLRVGIGILLWSALSQSWNIIGGYTGYLNFGHGAFFGIGAYATALGMNELDLPFLATLPLGGLLTSLLAIVIGYPTLRLRGAYFAIATWAFAEMVKQLALILPFTGGPHGIQVDTPLNDILVYYLMLAGFLITMLVSWYLLERAPFGQKLQAIRENEIAAESLGIDTTRIKIQAFALSAFFPGMLGGIYTYWISFIHPQSVLDASVTDQLIVMTLLGGLGSFWGPAMGASILWLINRVIWSYWGESPIYLVMLGLTVCLIVLYLPDGLVGLMQGRRGGRWRDNARYLLRRFGVET